MNRAHRLNFIFFLCIYFQLLDLTFLYLAFRNWTFLSCFFRFNTQAAPVQQVQVTNGDDADDDIDLFGSDEEDEEAERLKQERLEAYAAKKAKKPAVIAKSSILLDVKPVSRDGNSGY